MKAIASPCPARRNEARWAELLASYRPPAALAVEVADAWELYGGSAGVTRAWRREGLAVFEPLDLRNRPWQNLLRPQVQEWILNRIRARRVRILFLAPPCRSFSVMRVYRYGTRSSEYPAGNGSDPVEVEGNLHAEFVRRVIVACLAAGVTFILEHPAGSFLWQLPGFVALAMQPSVHMMVFDQCMYGACVPHADGPPPGLEDPELIRKRTRLLTNHPAYLGLRRMCNGLHRHEQLEGSVWTADGWKSKTALAAAYPRAFCRKVAVLSGRVLAPRVAARSVDRWRRLIELIRAGDVERHPGPPRQRCAYRATRAGRDLLFHDVADSTRAQYESRLLALTDFFLHRGFLDLSAILSGDQAAVTARLVTFLRYQYRSRAWGRAAAVQLVAALKRHLVWEAALGRTAHPPELVLEPARRLVRAWARSEPVECHTPVPLFVAQSLFVTFVTSGNHAAATIVGLCFHCLVRVEEVMCLRWGAIAEAPAAFRAAYPDVRGLITIDKPKLRTGVGRNNHQFAIVEEQTLADYFAWLTVNLTDQDKQQLVWPGGAQDFIKHWDAALRLLGLTGLDLTPSGLRPGGVTHHFLIHQNVPLLRRRGRWQSDRTLEHYLHEVIYAQQYVRMAPEIQARLQTIAAGAAHFARPPPSPAPPVACRIQPLGVGGSMRPMGPATDGAHHFQWRRAAV